MALALNQVSALHLQIFVHACCSSRPVAAHGVLTGRSCCHADEVCSALSVLAGPIQSALHRSDPGLPDEQRGTLLLDWASGWSRCMEIIYEELPASLPHAEQVLAAAASALHIAAAAEGWFEECR